MASSRTGRRRPLKAVWRRIDTGVAGWGLMLTAACLLCACQEAVRYPSGRVAPDDPVQEPVPHGAVFLVDDYLVRPVARFQLQARLLSKERYRFDREADLSPIDFALGWGPMSDQAVLDQIRIRQGHRFYHWSAKRFPISRRDIIEHSANMHLIPAGDEVKDALLSVPKGAVVRLEGYLVSVTSGDGWQWRSSLSRTDTGAGACELVWVERVEVQAAPLAAAE